MRSVGGDERETVVEMECSVSQVYHCQYPGSATVLQFCKMLPLR